MIEGLPIKFTKGLVINYSPATMLSDVVLPEGGCLYNVPILNSYGSPMSSDMSASPNLRGATVVILELSTKPYIIGTIPQEIIAKAKLSSQENISDFGGKNSQTYGQPSVEAVESGRVTSILPLDKVFKAEGGAELSLFSEGMVRLKASPLAQFILGAMKDFARLIAREFKFFTDFGEIHFKHGDGKRVGMHLKGGGIYLTETSPTKENWTIQVWLGDVDAPIDNKETQRLHVRVNNIANSEYVTLSYGIDGTAIMETSKDNVNLVGRDHTEVILGKRDTFIGKNDTLGVEGAQDITIKKDLTHYSANMFHTSGHVDFHCKSFDIRKR